MGTEARYNPPPEFLEESVDSIVDIDLNDSTELWLIQLPEDHSPDFDGQELSLELHRDGQLGSLEGSSGKLYNMLSYSAQESDEIVFLSSSSRSKIVGKKISRHVSLVHYPEPEELKADAKKQMPLPLSSTTLLTNSHMSKRSSHSPSKSRSTHTSRKSSQSEIGDESKSSKRTAGERSHSRFSDHSVQDSGRGSGITVSGSSEQSQRKKSKKKTESET